jgi:DNA primase
MTTQTADLYTLIGQDTVLKKASGTHGGEYQGACPFCGGKDRFRVWPNDTKPGWWCRMCEKGGDAIQYLREKGYTFKMRAHCLACR